jgi:hypothetical protein
MPFPPHEHLDDEEIEKYSMGKAAPEEEAAWEEHLLECGSCRDRVEAAEAFAKAMRSAAGELRRKRAAPSSRSSLFRLLPAVAAFAAAALIVTFWASWRSRIDAPPAVVTLRAMRGADINATAPAGRLLDLHLDAAEVARSPAYRVEIVGLRGARIWSGPAAVHGSEAEAQAPPQESGVYYVRLYSQSGILLREYALNVGGR